MISAYFPNWQFSHFWVWFFSKFPSWWFPSFIKFFAKSPFFKKFVFQLFYPSIQLEWASSCPSLRSQQCLSPIPHCLTHTPPTHFTPSLLQICLPAVALRPLVRSRMRPLLLAGRVTWKSWAKTSRFLSKLEGKSLEKCSRRVPLDFLNFGVYLPFSNFIGLRRIWWSNSFFFIKTSLLAESLNCLRMLVQRFQSQWSLRRRSPRSSQTTASMCPTSLSPSEKSTWPTCSLRKLEWWKN